MSILLSKSDLDEGWIDASPGEAHLISDIFLNHYGRDFSISLNNIITEYPHSSGLPALVALLEEKHNAPIILTNGAKQGLSACFYALKKLGRTKTLLPTPYWCLLPFSLHKEGLSITDKNYDNILLVAPNNPDGKILSYAELKHQSDMAKECNIPFIHDAAYYTHTYLPNDYTTGTLGDIQIYSISKKFGMSGWRLGYLVVNNTEYYHLLKEYMEMMTVGVSTLSQSFLKAILLADKKEPENKRDFIHYSFAALQNAKLKIKTIRKDILDIPDNVEEINHGMFLWAKKGKNIDLDKAKISVVDGSLFGAEGFIRMNLALRPSVLDEVIRRLNNL